MNITKSCQAHMPMQYALNIEFIRHILGPSIPRLVADIQVNVYI